MRLLALLATLAFCAGCPGPSLANCTNEPDITGSWTFSLAATDGGAPTIPNAMTIDAELQQIKSTSALALSSPLWGTLASSDKGAFDKLVIPQLMHNNGGKTGGIFGCELKINVPIAMPVSDDDVDQGPLRIALTGDVSARGKIEGQLSTLIRSDGNGKQQLSFTWTGAQN